MQGATYQRLMERVFMEQIGKNLEVYIDDMVVKTEKKGEHDKDLDDILKSVKKYNMRLNPAKRSFGVHTGKFLGFLLTHRGIEANPDKRQAIINMRSPTSVKEVQQLTGRIAALSRFLSCSGEKTCHFFATLRKSERFTWSPQCEEAFQTIKVFLVSPLILTRPEQGKTLHLYLAVSGKALSSAPVQEVGGEEKPIYSVSRTLRGAETRYQKIERLCLVVEEWSHGQPWTLSVDGSSNLRSSGAGVVLEGPEGVFIEQSLRFAFKASNNQAEYEALIVGMKLAKEMEVQELKVQSDSQLVANHVSGEFQTKDPQLAKYLEKVKGMAKHFAMFELTYVPREQNARADLLEKLASTKKPAEAKKIRKMAAWYTMVGDKLYKRGFSAPMLLCVSNTEACRILNEIHEGSCGSHIGSRSLAGKAQAKWITVAVDYFTKWVEAEPLSDNGTQFASEKVVEYCRGKGIQNTFISVEHPQANGQAESTNKVILRALNIRINSKQESWVEHLPGILWLYHTTPQSSTGEPPFTMVYGSDAMILVEIQPSTWRRDTLTLQENNAALEESLDLLPQLREKAHFREFYTKQRAARKYNTRVIPRKFKEGDLVLKRPMGRDKGGKMAANWEGPFRIHEAFEGGAYRLETMEGEIIPRTWNIANLRFYYS
ncbi:hypothetical protein TSUD_326890 [Trifolium subterraneum]|uniref:Uncharacterized protein n=1 Tax=Trifolium subterraneum TaxID=3900 RepID=A0A2Z6LVI8_TRISU|nr:hypothetical protein TSUD_326890 [Trifolium subterraneum]